MKRPARRRWIRWGLFNYTRLWSIHWTRKDAKTEGANMFIGGQPQFEKEFKAGSMRVARVEIRELPRGRK